MSRRSAAVAVNAAPDAVATPSWGSHAGSAPHHQGQVYDQATGQTLAVTYHDEGGVRAAMMASAPTVRAAAEQLAAALQSVLTGFRDRGAGYPDRELHATPEQIEARAAAALKLARDSGL